MSTPNKDAARVRLRPFEILLNRAQIAERIRMLGQEITRDYHGEAPVLVGVLKGCAVFLADLMREINLPMELEFVSASSYHRGTRQVEDISFGGPIPIDLKGRHVLIVEGVVDTGRTVTSIMKQLKVKEPASIEVVTLVDKPGCHRVDLEVKYVGFSLGNEFVIGYGLDNTQHYRNLPYIGRMVERE